MANNEILQIVIFSLFFGVATAAIGEKGEVVIKAMDAIAHVILKITGYVMQAGAFSRIWRHNGYYCQTGVGYPIYLCHIYQ
jgi:Na+/H+-dicarboxylate symporter